MRDSIIYMKIVGTIVGVTVFAIALGGLWIGVRNAETTRADAASATPIEVRWLVSHQPVDVFARATQVFADELAKETNGEMSLVVVTPEQLGLSGAGEIAESKITELMDTGSIDLASPYTIPLGDRSRDFWSLNLPFLFETYAEAAVALDGQAGTEILSGLSTKATARGLAFTMSGGFRIIASKDAPIVAASDLKGKRIATSGGPVAEATLRALGATPVSLDLENGNAPDLSNIDGVETTYARLAGLVGSNSPYTKYINETNHSIFLTAITVSSSFYDSLSPAHREALQKAARAAAQVEREDSIALNASTKTALSENGSTITTLSPSDRSVLRTVTRSVYTQFESQFEAGRIEGLSPQN